MKSIRNICFLMPFDKCTVCASARNRFTSKDLFKTVVVPNRADGRVVGPKSQGRQWWTVKKKPGREFRREVLSISKTTSVPGEDYFASLLQGLQTIPGQLGKLVQ